MKLIDMKVDRSSQEEKVEMDGKMAQQPAYPYGLNISLDEDALEKLGLDPLPKVGAKFALQASVEVQSVHQSDSKMGKPSQSVSLQITKMALDGGIKDITKTLYGE